MQGNEKSAGKSQKKSWFQGLQSEFRKIVACLVDGEDATLKRFRRQRDMVLLQPENPVYEPKLVPLSDFETGAARIVGVAVRLVREL